MREFFVAFVAWSIISQAAATATPLKILAVTGDSAPDGNGVFSSLDIPTLNERGQVAFRATLTGTSGGFQDSSGIYRVEQTSEIFQVARQGSPIPTTPYRYGNLNSRDAWTSPLINNLGQVLFQSQLNDGVSGNSLNKSGILLSRGPAESIPIVIGGSPAPGSTAISPKSFSVNEDTRFDLNDSGQIAFKVDIDSESSTFEEIYLHTNEESLVEITTNRFDELVGGIRSLNLMSSPIINESGRVGFSSLSVPISSGGGVFAGNANGDFEALAVIGQLSPLGNGSFTTESAMFAPAMNQAGFVAFRQRVRHPDGSLSRELYLGKNQETLEIIAQAEQLTTGQSGIITDIVNPAAINHVGQVAFAAELDGDRNNRGVYLYNNGEQIPIVIPGELAPDGNGVLRQTLSPILNNRGQIAFDAILAETILGTQDDFGIYFSNTNRQITQVAREGDLLLGSPITLLNMYNRPEFQSLNDAGQIAFRFTLADGREGIALWSIPEPQAMLLALLATSPLLRRQRRYQR